MDVQGEENLGDMLEPLHWGVRGEEGVTNEEDKVLEWTELDCPAMDGALGLLTRTQSELESQDNQNGGVLGLLVGG